MDDPIVEPQRKPADWFNANLALLPNTKRAVLTRYQTVKGAQQYQVMQYEAERQFWTSTPDGIVVYWTPKSRLLNGKPQPAPWWCELPEEPEEAQP